MRLPLIRATRPLVVPKFLAPSISSTTLQCRTIRALLPTPMPSKYNHGPGLPMLKATPEASLARRIQANAIPHRTGLLAIKKGMSAVYDPETGVRTPVTIVQLDRVQVVAHKRQPEHGYWAVQVGIGSKAPKNVTRPLLGYFEAQGVSPKRDLVEFEVRDESGLPPVGYQLSADWYKPGMWVDVRAVSKGKGFAGGMKRWGFHGQDRSHGVSLTHRSMGSAGASQGGGSRVLPGKKMAGNMGNHFITVQSVKIMSVDVENGLIALKGPNKAVVQIKDAYRKAWPDVPPVPEVASPKKEAEAETTA